MTHKRLTKISKYLSYHLRHNPEALGLTLDKGGWVGVAALLKAAAADGFDMTPLELEAAVATNDKQRFSFDETGMRIRANQGHSTPIDLDLAPQHPPDVLYHGTGAQFVPAILKTGLKKMARHHVHLSAEPETAYKVGSRHGKPGYLSSQHSCDGASQLYLLLLCQWGVARRSRPAGLPGDHLAMTYQPLNLSTSVPVLSWANHDLGHQEIQMAKNVASLPFVFKHVALMPDVHLGKGALVGSVVATQDAIMPAAVGVDIGCGMGAVQTPFTASQLDSKKLKKIRNAVEAEIPVGFNQNKAADKTVYNWQGWQDFKHLHSGVQHLDSKALMQMGSLGGGNHFIELCLDTDDRVWLMLHSGSRNIGNMLAKNHIQTAKGLAKLAQAKLPDPDLAYFVAGTDEFAAYWRDLQWAQDYARYNRDVMMARFKRIVEGHLAGGKPTKPLLSVNCHHNYAEKEIHFGKDVYVTRKGAVRAQTNDYGIIPGSMGAKSFIVKGKGHPDSYCSCSHGAGRLMSRSKAKRQFSVDDVVKQTEGIECRKDAGVIDEIPAAYKPIEEVMASQADLVEVVATLKQVLCVKG